MHQKHSPIRLRKDGPDMVVEIDFGIPNRDGETHVEIIREKLTGWPECEVCHEVLDSGIEAAKDRHYNGH